MTGSVNCEIFGSSSIKPTEPVVTSNCSIPSAGKTVLGGSLERAVSSEVDL